MLSLNFEDSRPNDSSVASRKSTDNETDGFQQRDNETDRFQERDIVDPGPSLIFYNHLQFK